jgi:hypothetical protein
LPAVTFVVNAHTDKKGQALFGSITQFADVGVLYQLERVEHANQATLNCVGARDIEEPPPITFEMEKVSIVTAKGDEINLVISKEAAAQPEKSVNEILSERIDKDEPRARRIVKIMVQHFLSGAKSGALKTQFEKETGLQKQTFYDGLAYATTVKQWMVSSGEGKGKRYNLNPNGSWKEAAQEAGDWSDGIGPSVPPLRGERTNGPMDQSADQSNRTENGPKRTDGPTADSSNPATTAPIDSIEVSDQADSIPAQRIAPRQDLSEILTNIMKRDGSHEETLKKMAEAAKLTNQAIQHADKKRNG